jgi:FeS assembly protein IscX
LPLIPYSNNGFSDVFLKFFLNRNNKILNGEKMHISWEDLDDIAIELYEKYPNIDPLTVRFTDLLDYVLKIDDFSGTREESNEGKLEAIQMAWYEEWKDENN